MMLIMKPLKILALTFESRIAREPLPPKELVVVGVIEALHDSITPRFSNRDEYRCYAVEQTEPDDNTKRPGMPDTPPEAQLIVQLQEVRHSHRLPAPRQTLCNLVVLLCPLSLNVYPVATDIDYVERVKLSIMLDVTRANEIRLMDVVDAKGLPEIRILNTLGDIIRTLFFTNPSAFTIRLMVRSDGNSTPNFFISHLMAETPIWAKASDSSRFLTEMIRSLW
jgi:hypothetical protein